MEGHFVKNRNNQTGSAHLIIIIVLVIALLGSLGFVFWQNFVKVKDNQPVQNNQISNTTDKSATASKTSNETKLTEIAADDLVGTNLALKYPKTWTATHEDFSTVEAGAPILNKMYKISSPDNDISVKFGVTNVGGGGTCDDEPGRKITQLDKSEIPGNKNIFFVSYSDEQGAFYAGTMKNAEKAQAAQIGDSSCSVSSFGQLSGMIPNIDNSKSLEVTLRLEIEFNNIAHDRNAETTIKFRQALNTENYKTAKSIIESLYVKN